MARSNDGDCLSAQTPERDCEVMRLATTALPALTVTRAYKKSLLAALAILDPLRRQRWGLASLRGQHTDRRRDGLNQQAERYDQ